jgi:hypothetical protein
LRKRLQRKSLSTHHSGMSQNYIAKRGDNYYVVVAENGEATEEHAITDPELIAKIEALLETRRLAGEELTRLLVETGPHIASAHHQATIALGEGQARGNDPEPKQE